MIKKSSKKNQEQTIAHALYFFLYGQPFLLAALKKAFTRIGTAFVHCHARVKYMTQHSVIDFKLHCFSLLVDFLCNKELKKSENKKENNK